MLMVKKMIGSGNRYDLHPCMPELCTPVFAQAPVFATKDNLRFDWRRFEGLQGLLTIPSYIG